VPSLSQPGLQQMQNHLGVFGIVLVPRVVHGFASAGERQSRNQPQLEALRDELRTEPEPDVTKTRLLELLNRHRLMEADAVSRELSLSIEEVASCARRYPMHFGLLEGPPLVLFEAVEGSPPETPHA